MPFIFGKNTLEFSITNPETNKNDALDAKQPFSFFEFLKYSGSLGSPLEYNNAYNEYLQTWYNEKNTNQVDIINEVANRYIELLKDITLNYTTLEEKRFLSNIDFNDSYDINIAIPFFSKKIKEICNFYCKKREHARFKIEYNKVKGTELSIDKLVFNVIDDYLSSNSNLTISNIISCLNIEVEDLYDFYTNYFDIDPTKSAEFYNVLNPLRQQIFTSNTNEISADLFCNFSQELKNQIFNIPVFLNELGKNFTINYNLDAVNLNCNTDDVLYTLVKTNSAEQGTLLNLKKKLIEKFIGTDFYFLSTDSTLTNVNSGKLFTAENPTGNLLNRHFPSTATVEENSELKTLRQIGLFFKPDKLGVLYYSAANYSYKIDNSKLEPNKIYIFPDPSRYGKTITDTKAYYDTPLVFTIDCSESVHSYCHGYAYGDIKNTQNRQDFFAYSTNLHDNTYNLQGLEEGISSLYGSGVIEDWKTDIYGNQYFLFKNKAKQLREFDVISDKRINLLGGWFNVDTLQLPVGWYTESIFNPGITMLGGTDITLTLSDFSSDSSVIIEDANLGNQDIDGCSIIDAGYYISEGGMILPDAETGDSFNWNESTGLFYYTTLIDAGIGSVSPLKRAVTDNLALSANMQFEPLSSEKVLYEGGSFTDDICSFSSNNAVNIPFINKIISGSETIYDLETECNDITGTIFVKNVYDNTVLASTIALSSIFNKYNTAVKTELYSNVRNINVFYDTLFVRTDNYFVINKVDDTNIVSKNIVLSATNNNLINISQPFFFEQKNYCIFSILSSNNLVTIPTIYTYNFDTNNVEQIYPQGETQTELQNLFDVSTQDINKIKEPLMVYNSRNDKHAIIYVSEDSTNRPIVNLISFTHTVNGVNVEANNSYKLTSTNVSNSATQTSTFNLSSSNSSVVQYTSGASVYGRTEVIFNLDHIISRTPISVNISFGDGQNYYNEIDGNSILTVPHVYNTGNSNITTYECVINVTYIDLTEQIHIIPVDVHQISFVEQFGSLDIISAQFVSVSSNDIFVVYRDETGNLYNNRLIH